MNRSHLLISLLILLPAVGSPKSVQSSAEIVISALSGEGETRHLTPYLLDIAKNGHGLNEATKNQLKALGFNFSGKLVNRSDANRKEAAGLDESINRGHFRFHYTTIGTNAVDSKDTNADGIPDYVETIAAIFDTVAQVQHNILGYNRPPGDGWYSSTRDNGGSDHYDVYIRNLSSVYYGYAWPEYYAQGNGDNEHSSAREVNAFTSYIALRNNYAGFPNNELDNIRVTVAHEYFHSIQFGYDGWEEAWLLEATATWMEEILYDDINDWYQYMPDWFNQPHKALDAIGGTHWYSSFIFFQYIEEHLGGRQVLKDLFDFSVDRDSKKINSSHWSIHQALKKQGSGFTEALNNMVIANQIMSSLPAAKIYAYEEAADYPVDGPSRMATENFQTSGQDTISSNQLERFASQYVRVFASTPVRVDLTNLSGPFQDLQMHAIMKMNDDSYKILSGPSVNIDPIDIKSIYIAVVSQDTTVDNWDFQLAFEDGEPGTGTPGPEEFLLSDPYPNPFNVRLQFSVYMFGNTRLRVNVIDITGRRVAEIWNGTLKAGNHNLTWNGKLTSGSDAPSGVYMLVVAGKTTQEWKMITLVK